ncbi:helix-turn-helix transcriptional regulator [Hydrogenophaga sp.]|uniref:helix-turn-helix transcriptional regulator n=1 Tax=Hydrogenophaga sp. TaxID=1904254 RepID=UPI003D12E3C9
MKASRLLSILMLLQARGRMTAPALAQAMEVSVRTVLRDIDQLSAAGVPLWGERGRLGGFQLREGWSTQLTGMTEPEAHALLLAGLPGPATELGLGAAAASARLKMVASLPSGWREQADRVGERLHIDPVDWYRTQDAPRFLREVADAVWRARRIEVRYESWRGQARRVLEPLGLVLKAGAWYLVARPADAASGQGDRVRTYRLASLLELKVGAAFRRPRSFDLARTWQASAARFESELRAVQVRARVSPRCLRWLANARIPFTDREGDEVTIRVESIEQGARKLLGFGDEIEVLAPPALRERMAQQAAAVLAKYPAVGS